LQSPSGRFLCPRETHTPLRVPSYVCVVVVVALVVRVVVVRVLVLVLVLVVFIC
jgi:hypothetical protein